MTRTWWLSTLMTVLPALAFAQPGGPGGPGPGDEPEMEAEEGEGGKGGQKHERFLNLLDKKLKLKDDQKKRIKTILDEGAPKMKELHKEMKALHEKMRTQMRTQNEKIRGILNDEQRETFDEISVEMKRGMRSGGMRGPRGQGGGRWRKPGPPDEKDEEMKDARDLPPPEMWHKGDKGGEDAPEKRPKKGE